MAEHFERHHSGQIGEIFIHDPAQRHGLFGGMKPDGFLDGVGGFAGKFDMDVAEAEGWLMDGQPGGIPRLGSERHFPRAAPGSELIIDEEDDAVDDPCQQEGGKKVPQNIKFSRGRIQSRPNPGPPTASMVVQAPAWQETMRADAGQDELKNECLG
jgi:hypothetical protein